MRFLSNRMVEIAHILEENGLIGGGVYNFSYLVMGPVLSFIAVASILVDYILTAALSSVSAVENGLAFLGLDPGTKFIAEMIVIWAVAGLNILGIKENAKVTFGIFVITACFFLNFIISGFFEMGPREYQNIATGAKVAFDTVTGHGFFRGYWILIASVSSCILAYSGIESVLQTATFVKSWKDIRKAYLFLALTVGIVTPLVTALVLSHAHFDFAAHETDLIPYYASLLNGRWFGVFASVIAFITLVMAVNTAFVASSELIERVAHRYNIQWIIKTNRFDSLYVLHISNAILYSGIIFVTAGKQMVLAEMYALGLVGSFVINMGMLVLYRYQKGKTEAQGYTTSRVGTFLLFIILVSCFIYLMTHKPYGTILWLSVTILALTAGIFIARKRAPEIAQEMKGDSTMDLLLYMASHDEKNINLYFKRPLDKPNLHTYGLSVYITFYSPRRGIPPKMAENHFRLPVKRTNLYNNTLAILDLMAFEMPDHHVTVHFGWPTSNWLDRLSVGFMTYQIMQLPLHYPRFNFKIEQFSQAEKKKE